MVIKKYCKCNCGKRVRLLHHTYIYGHNNVGAGYGFKKGHKINLGKKSSKKTIEKLKGNTYAKGHIPKVKGKTFKEVYGEKRTQKINQMRNKSRRNNNKLWVSENTKNKISKKLKGRKKTPFTKNHRHNLSKAHVGYIPSKKTREKISNSHTGEKKFTGFKRPKNKRIRGSSKFKRWRNAVFTRDDYTCQNPNCHYCKNKKGGMTLHPHHKKRFSKILKEHNITSIYEAFCCIPLWDISNGITYCKNFHIHGGIHRNGK